MKIIKTVNGINLIVMLLIFAGALMGGFYGKIPIVGFFVPLGLIILIALILEIIKLKLIQKIINKSNSSELENSKLRKHLFGKRYITKNYCEQILQIK